MKLKQKQISKKSSNMAAQPLKNNKAQQRMTSQNYQIQNMNQRSPYFLASPDFLLQQNWDQIDEENDKKSNLQEGIQDSINNDLKKSKINNGTSKKNLQKQEQKNTKIHQKYIYDYYHLILRPIAHYTIKNSLIFVLLFLLFKIFWIYEQISLRKSSQQMYLRNIMNEKISIVQQEYKQAFSCITSIHQIYSHNLSNIILKSKKQNTCQDFENRYFCDNFQDQDMDFYKAFDINYDLLSIQIGFLLNQNKVDNIFVFNSLKDQILQINLTKIQQETYFIGFKNKDKDNLMNESEFTSDQIQVLSNYLKILISQQDQQQEQGQIISYLDIQQSQGYNYRWFQIYKYQNSKNKTQNQQPTIKFNLYCLSFKINYFVQEDYTLCVNVKYRSQNKNLSNLIYITTQFQKIYINGTNIISGQQNGDQMQQFYQKIQHFMSTQVTPKYPEYQMMNSKQFIQCLQNHDSFYQIFADQQLELEIFRCYPSDYVHMLLTKYLMSWSLLKIDKITPFKAAYTIKKEEEYEAQYFIFSNVTFFKQIHEITRKGIQIVENTLKTFMVGVFIVIISYQTSTKIIEQKMFKPLSLIKKISNLIKNNDDLKLTQSQLKKIIRYNDQDKQGFKIHIFKILIHFMKKFLWIKKLIVNKKKFPNNKNLQKSLLYEGLKYFKYGIQDPKDSKLSTKNISQLFEDESDSLVQYKQISRINNYKKYSAVIIYIYQQLIHFYFETIQLQKNIRVLLKKTQPKSKPDLENQQILPKIQDDSDDKIYIQNKKNLVKEKQKTPESLIIQPKGILQLKPRQNKGVRFSNQIQFKNFNKQQKKSKFRQTIRSNSSIGKKSSLKSVKSIQSDLKMKGDESQKISRSEQDSMIRSTNKKLKRDTTIKNLLMGEKSIHQDLYSYKFDQDSNLNDGKSSYYNRQQQFEMQSQDVQFHFQIYKSQYKDKQIIKKMGQNYLRIYQYYEQLIQIRQKNLQKLKNNKKIGYQQQEQKVNQIYQTQIKKLQICYKYLKLILEENLWGEIDVLKNVSLDFTNLKYYQDKYKISQNLIDKSKLFKMRIDICLGKTISYKQLQEICKSENLQIFLEANYLYSEELSKLQPFLDFQVLNTCNNCLCNYQTNVSYKIKSIDLMTKTLARNKQQFNHQIQQLYLIKKFYNQKHKKFYFIADMTQSYDIFTPILTKLYEAMGKMDLMQIFKLGMEYQDDLQIVNQTQKPKTVQVFLSLFQQLTLDSQKSKQKNSQKNIDKKLTYQQGFYEILRSVQKDESQFSTYLVVILGADQLSNHSSVITDDVQSSTKQRKINQILYSEINKSIQKNYFHIILLGTNLNNYMTKQGKLKKHIKNSFDLLQIDLVKKNVQEHYNNIDKFINA